MSTLVCFAVKEEAAVFRRTPAAARVDILLTGMGQANAGKSFRNFLAGGASVPASRLVNSLAPPGLVITSGCAGGLNPQLATGDVVFELDGWGERPREPLAPATPGSSAASPRQSLREKLLAAGAHEGKFHCAGRIATTAEEKWTLWQKTGADAVEMESQIIRDICREQNIPCAAVRVILDQAGEDLPLDFNALLTPDMRLDGAKLALTILKPCGNRVDSVAPVMNFDSMRTTSMMTISRRTRASARPKARRGAKGLLAHLREQSVSFPSVRRHPLPAK